MRALITLIIVTLRSMPEDIFYAAAGILCGLIGLLMLEGGEAGVILGLVTVLIGCAFIIRSFVLLYRSRL